MQLIKAGTLQPGVPLPSSRDMANLMKLNRTTVVAAYDELRIQGWIEAIARKGFAVSGKLPVLHPKSFHANQHQPVKKPATTPSFYKIISPEGAAQMQRKVYDLVVGDGYPDARIAPLQLLINKYRALQNRHYKHMSVINELPAGSALLRNELATFLSQTRGLNIAADNILLTRGAQAAIYLAAQMIVKPGSRVIVGVLNYSKANKVFEQLGATLVKVNIDENGIDVDRIEEICKTDRPDLLYIIPHHHHPTTVTLSPERRIKLLNIIRTYQLPVIEDDYDYDFHYENSPILPLASADHDGLVLYIGSITKMLSLTIRCGFLVAGTDLIWQAGKLKELMELRSDLLMEDAIGHLFKTGEMQRHIARSVKLYKARRDTFCNMLATTLAHVLRFNTPAGGMAVWALFNPEFPLPVISKSLAREGIYMNDGSLYNQGNAAVNGVRLGFAAMNEEEMGDFVLKVAECAIKISNRANF